MARRKYTEDERREYVTKALSLKKEYPWMTTNDLAKKLYLKVGTLSSWLFIYHGYKEKK